VRCGAREEGEARERRGRARSPGEKRGPRPADQSFADSAREAPAAERSALEGGPSRARNLAQRGAVPPSVLEGTASEGRSQPAQVPVLSKLVRGATRASGAPSSTRTASSIRARGYCRFPDHESAMGSRLVRRQEFAHAGWGPWITPAEPQARALPRKGQGGSSVQAHRLSGIARDSSRRPRRRQLEGASPQGVATPAAGTLRLTWHPPKQRGDAPADIGGKQGPDPPNSLRARRSLAFLRDLLAETKLPRGRAPQKPENSSPPRERYRERDFGPGLVRSADVLRARNPHSRPGPLAGRCWESTSNLRGDHATREGPSRRAGEAAGRRKARSSLRASEGQCSVGGPGALTGRGFDLSTWGFGEARDSDREGGGFLSRPVSRQAAWGPFARRPLLGFVGARLIFAISWPAWDLRKIPRRGAPTLRSPKIRRVRPHRGASSPRRARGPSLSGPGALAVYSHEPGSRQGVPASRS